VGGGASCGHVIVSQTETVVSRRIRQRATASVLTMSSHDGGNNNNNSSNEPRDDDDDELTTTNNDVASNDNDYDDGTVSLTDQRVCNVV